MRIVVTNYENKDFQHLNDLVDDEYYQLFGDIVLQYRVHNRIDSLDTVVLIYVGGNAAACGGFRKYDDNTVEVKRVFVRKEYRRQGLAITLMKKLEEIAGERGYGKAVLETGGVMDAAIALYKKLGYEIMDNFGAFESDELCVCMQKEL